MWLWIVVALALLGIWGGPLLVKGQPGPAGGEAVPWLSLSEQAWASLGVVALVAVVLLGRLGIARLRDYRRKRRLRLEAEPSRAVEATGLTAPERERLRKRVDAGRQVLTRETGLLRRWRQLNARPWALLIGEPASGKTAALQHSGVHFPVGDPAFPPGHSEGPTKQLRWWFGNEAVLLEAPGRYVAEPDSRQEWQALLGLLGRGRRLTVDLVIGCVSSEALGRRSAAELESLAGRLRQCIDDVVDKGGTAPVVHLLVTKSDLVPGFDLFFSNLDDASRQQALGFSFEAPREQRVAEAVGAEFDTLVEQLERRAVLWLGKGTQENATGVLQFPSEFAQLRDPLRRFCAALFRHNAYSDNPRLRGVFFGSALRQGAPLDSALAHDTAALGLGLPRTPSVSASEGSFFLRDWLARNVLQDSGLGRSSTAATKRDTRRGRLAVAAAAVFSAVLLLPAVVSYQHHRTLVSMLSQSMAATESPEPETRADLRQQVRSLTDLRAKLDELDSGLDWGMRPPLDLSPRAHSSYAAAISRLVINPTLPALRRDLLDVQGEPNPFAAARQRLKLYLQMHRPKRLQTEKDRSFVADQVVERWRSTSVGKLADATVEQAVRKHFVRWLQLVAAGSVAPLPEDHRRIQQARERLPEMWAAKKTLYRELLARTEASAQLRSVDRDTLFSASSPVRSDNPSARRGTGDLSQVPGLYTRVGFDQFFAHLSRWENRLLANAWVIDESPKDFEDKIRARAAEYGQDYTNDYIEAWRAFLAGLRVTPPKTLEAARAQLNALFPRPFQTLLEAVEEHTALPDPATSLGGSVQQKVGALRVKPEPKPNYREQIGTQFHNLVEFLGDPSGKEPKLSPLYAYQEVLRNLVGSFNDYANAPPSDKGATDALLESFNQARAATSNLLVSLASPNRALLTRLLLDPLTRGQVFVNHRQSAGIGELWIQEVHSRWAGHFDDYPFDSSRKTHVDLNDIQQFFDPNQGVLRQFVRDYLVGTYLDAQGQVIHNRSARRLSPEFLTNCLSLARRIGNELFVDKPWPYAEYSVSLVDRSDALAGAAISFGVGQQWKTLGDGAELLSWPSMAAKTANPLETPFPERHRKDGWAAILVKVGSETEERLSREGSFGLVELLSAGEHVGNFEYRWRTQHIPGGWVHLRVEPTERAQSRLGVSERLFAGFRLPKSIFQ